MCARISRHELCPRLFVILVIGKRTLLSLLTRQPGKLTSKAVNNYEDCSFNRQRNPSHHHQLSVTTIRLSIKRMIAGFTPVQYVGPKNQNLGGKPPETCRRILCATTAVFCGANMLSNLPEELTRRRNTWPESSKIPILARLILPQRDQGLWQTKDRLRTKPNGKVHLWLLLLLRK
jgi:hypothetical protein